MSEKEGANELSTEERIKNLEEKANKFEILLAINFCISLLGMFIIWFIGSFFGSLNIIISIFLGIYGIINLIILNKNNKKSPK